MTMTLGTQRPDTKVEVILGVDTHLDFHTAVAVDPRPNRKLAMGPIWFERTVDEWEKRRKDG